MIRSVLPSERSRNWLLIANALVAVLVIHVFRAPHGDLGDYLPLADGILHGEYSAWYRLPVDVPDTFRNPGYPLLLAAIKCIGTDLRWVQGVQVVLYLLSVGAMLRVLGRLGGPMASNLFLLFLLPSINILYFSMGILPEIPTLFFISLFLWGDVLMNEGWRRHVFMALCVGAAFQCRSTWLLFPIARVLAELLVLRRTFNRKGALLFLAVFGATLMPFGLWNLRHHGVFKVTSLEGGAGVMHLGWWAGKIPGHQEWWYWGNFFSPEPISFTDDVPGNIAAFDAECRTMDSMLRPYLTAVDTLMLNAPKAVISVRTYNTRYTLERERILKDMTWRHVKEEPGYTLEWKAYSAARIWFTGLNMDRFRKASAMGKIAELYPFAVTFSIFLLALVVVPLTLLRHRDLVRRLLPLWSVLLYTAVIHIPFAIQARYTIPARLVLLAMIALCLERSILRRADRDRTNVRTDAPSGPLAAGGADRR